VVNPTTLLLVGLGGALGSMVRLGFSWWLGPYCRELNPGTLAVNVLGGLILGLLVAVNPAPAKPGLVALGVVGFCGGLTTFSAFGLDLYHLLQQRMWISALAYSAGTIVLNLAALAVGLGIGHAFKSLG